MGIAESKLAATAFRLAVGSPLVQAVLNTLDRLAGTSSEVVDHWQADRALATLRRAGRRVSAYRDPRYSVADWASMPILTKDELRKNPDRYRDPRVRARRVTTGGTGGRPLGVDIALRSFFLEWAHIAYAWRSAGVGLADRKITFRGSSLGRGFTTEPVFFQQTYNHFVVSPFHLSDATFVSLLSEIETFSPVAIWGYPSAITPFANWVKRTGPHPQLRSVKAVLLASEGAFDWQVDLFRGVFGAQVVRWYGQTEKVAFAAGCPLSDGYHALPTYGLLEVVGGRILGTGFTNRAMPLVRYDTEDVATMASSACACGLPFPKIDNIRGRWDQAYLWGVEDEPISTSALNFHDPVFMALTGFSFVRMNPVGLYFGSPWKTHRPTRPRRWRMPAPRFRRELATASSLKSAGSIRMTCLPNAAKSSR